MKLFNRNITLIIFIGISIITVIFMNYQIKNDISYHAGKDNGYFKRLESVVLLNTLFFICMGREKRILFGLLGFIISIIASFFILYMKSLIIDFKLSDTILHLVTLGISYLSFFGIEKLIKKS